MKNITNAYLVLSVADIRAMLHAAELEQKVRGESRESITIVLEDITIICEGEEFPQITAWSVAAAVERHVAVSNEDLENGYSARARGAASTTMNHSDAAI